MRAAQKVSSFFAALRRLSHPRPEPVGVADAAAPLRIGLALGGGFARGIAHAGVLAVLDRYRIPIHCITGVSAGSIVAAAYASGASPAEIARAGCSMRFSQVARWGFPRMGFVASKRMETFLGRLLKCYRFEEMSIPLGVLATDLCTGEPVLFRDVGDVFLPIRASCSYPGLFQPVSCNGKLLVDGAMSMEIPALLARQLGATHVISVHLPTQGANRPPANVFQVVNRCFQMMQCRNGQEWRQASDLVIVPEVQAMEWDGFVSGPQLLKAGELAAAAAIPKIKSWLGNGEPVAAPAESRPRSLSARNTN